MKVQVYNSGSPKRLAVLGLVVVALPFALAAMGLEDSLIYHPEEELVGSPADWGLPFEVVRVRTSEGLTLRGWWIAPASEAPLVLWFHGNAGNISHRLPNALAMVRELGVGLLMAEYRGYGPNPGRPSEEGFYRDGRAFARLAFERSERVVIFGRSLGAAVALATAVEMRPLGLVLESPFRSIPAMAPHVFPWIRPRLAAALLRTRFDNEARIRRVRAPILIFHGDRDEVIPYEQGRSLAALAGPAATFVTLPGAGHNDTVDRGGDLYWSTWRAFIERLERRPLSPPAPGSPSSAD